MRIVFLGDSVTFGYGIRRKDTWITRLAERLDIEAVNLGVVGDTTGGMLARFQTEVVPRKPAAVFIMGCYNDIFAGESDVAARRNIMAMTHQAAAKGMVPILGVPPKISGEDAKPEWSEIFDFGKALSISSRYCAWLRCFAETFRITCVDFDREFARCMREDPEVDYLDGLHPNHKGQEAMANIFIESAGETIEWLRRAERAGGSC